MDKIAAAMLLRERVGQVFQAIVTGASPKGIFARLLDAPGEGLIVRGQQGLDVGERIRVRLLSVDVNKGFIDFERI